MVHGCLGAVMVAGVRRCGAGSVEGTLEGLGMRLIGLKIKQLKWPMYGYLEGHEARHLLIFTLKH